MITNNSGVIDLNLDMGDAIVKTSDLGKSLVGLQKEADRVGASITNALLPIVTSLKEIGSGVQSITVLLQEASTTISNVTTPATGGNQVGGFLESIKSGYDTLVSFIKSIEGFDASSGKITTLFEELVTAPNISNLLKSMLPKTSTLVSTVREWGSTNLVPAFTKAFTDLSATVGVASGTLLSPLKNVFQNTGSLLTPLKNTFQNAGSLLTPLKNAFQNTGSLISSKMSGIGNSIKGIFGSISNSIGGMSLGWGALIALVVGLVVAIIQNWDAIKAAIGTAAEWLNTNIIQPIVGFCTELWTSITTIVTQIWEGVVAVFSVVGQWIYDNVIVPVMDIFSPLIEWYAQLFGSVWQTISDIFHNIGVIICGCWDVIKAVWEIVATWFNDNVIQPVVQFFVNLGTSIAEFATNAWTAICDTFSAVGTWFNENVIQPVVQFFVGLGTSIAEFATNAWNAICDTFSAVGTWFYENVIEPVGSFFSDMWNGFLEAASSAWESVKSVFSAVAGFFEDIFSEAWAGVVKVFDVAGDIFVNIKDGILSVFKNIVNGLIDGINAVIAVPFNGINGALSIIKNIEIVGVTPFDGLKLLSIPEIPHLAKGAVLPANRPFMAIVGDQRHGTNVEAPLATIQEAVALVMEDQTQAIVAGFNASIGVQREILGAVLGIRIGDDVIAHAVDRYNRKMAKMGGYY